MQKIFKYLFAVILGVSAWFGLVENIIWCERIYKFTTWLSFVPVVLCYIAFSIDDTGVEKYSEALKLEDLNTWFNGLFYSYIVILSVATGYAWYGAMWVISVIITDHFKRIKQ